MSEQNSRPPRWEWVALTVSVPLRADIGWGSNWAEAAPAGH